MRFLCLYSLCDELPVMCIKSRFNAYSVIKLSSFSPMALERFSGLTGDFIFNYVSPIRTDYSYCFRTSIQCVGRCVPFRSQSGSINALT